MSFQSDQGLAKFDYVDHHAILGVPIDGKVGDIRKRYLKIARSLHPDSCMEGDKQLASQLLSKLVNPAYEKLTQDKERTEYEVLLRLLGQRLLQQKNGVELKSELAQQLFRADDPDNFYKNSVQDLAEKQYQVLDQAIELIGELSELNLAYLVVKAGKGEVTIGRSKQSPTPGSTGAAQASSLTPQQQPAAPAPPPQVSTPSPNQTFVNQYYRRAEEFLAKNNLQQAILELRDALKLEPSDSRCHALIGTIYLRQNQITMAKVHLNQALKLDPKNATALAGKQQLDKLEQKSNAAKQSGGLFGLFGGKKK